MVAYVHKHPNITLLDGTQTMRVIHQTDEDGNMAHGGTMKQSVADADYNMQFIPRKYLAKSKKISNAAFASYWSDKCHFVSGASLAVYEGWGDTMG